MTGLLWLLAAVTLAAQPIPVVLMNGYQSECFDQSSSKDTFGEMEVLLVRDGWKVRYFDNCKVRGRNERPSIEEMGQAFGAFLEAEGFTEVDVVAHSMGGLILRSYLSGKQVDGGFRPPAQVAIRKAVFMASPHAGILTQAPILAGDNPDIQLTSMYQGSRFLWELSTWNQGRDDLRGVDAIAVIADNGSGRLHDGAVSVTSGAYTRTLGDERVVVVPFCHQANMIQYICEGDGIANVTSDRHTGFRIVRSFLTASGEWRNLGKPPSQTAALSRYGGIHITVRNADNTDAAATRVALTTGRLSGELLHNSQGGFFADLLPAGEYRFRAETPRGAMELAWTTVAGHYPSVLLKAGTAITRVTPIEGRLEPGARIWIDGVQLDGAAVEIGGQSAAVLAVSSNRIETTIPEDLTGLAILKVTSPNGVAQTQILLADSAR